MIVSTDHIPLFVGESTLHGSISLDLASDAHMIITGQTRSGKSVFCYSLLSQLAKNPAVRVVGIDPTEVLLHPFACRGIYDPYLCTDPNAIPRMFDMLSWLKSEMDSRNAGLAYSMQDKVATFSPARPLIVCVLEEFPGLTRRCKAFDAAEGLKPAERFAPRVAGLVESLLGEGAKAGIRLILLAQRADADVIGGAARDNLPTRISFKLGNPEGWRMLFPGMEPHEIEATKSLPLGAGVIETPRQERTIFKGPFVRYQDYVRHVRSCDLEYLRASMIDARQREIIADEFPEIGDPG